MPSCMNTLIVIRYFILSYVSVIMDALNESAVGLRSLHGRVVC
jgi:hypothetical protein